MDNRINELLSEAVAKILEAESLAMHSLGKPGSIKHTDILRHINVIRCHLQECIDENK